MLEDPEKALEELGPALNSLPESQKRELYSLVESYERSVERQNAREDFISFIKLMMPSFVEGQHHKQMARAFERVLKGDLKRVIINMPPRHSKSLFASTFLPAWYLGHHPERKIIQASHTSELAVGFGRQVRNILADPDYQKVFPGVELSPDAKAAGRWNTNRKGEYFAIGVHGAVSGKGADILIIDDPHALEVNTPIPTPNGFVPIKDLRVGDQVYGPDGLPTAVIDKSDIWHDRELYRVRTSDGQDIFCDGGHLWPYRSDTKLSAAHKVASARELSSWDKASLPCLPRHSAVEYPERDLPIPPYTLGLWLGDGTASSAKISCDIDDHQFLRNEVEKDGFKTADQADRFNFGVLGLWPLLKKHSLLGNKHIPESYFTASVEQRLALLQGLMDSDGSVSRAGQCSFDNSDKALVEGVVHLLHSLGLKACLKSYEDTRGRWGSAKTKYRVTFRMKDAARLPRKREFTYTPTDKRCRSFTIEPTGDSGSVQCITVDREDGLFLAGHGYVVTHNSEQEAALAEHQPEIYDRVYEWYTSGPRQRLQPGGSIIIVATRWSLRDLPGQLIRRMEDPLADQWEVIELPAILPSGNLLWPEYWSKDEMLRTKASLPVSKWSAQYQQQPTSEEGALIKRDWWQPWERADVPELECVMQSWDTAFDASSRADYSACTTWGVFYTGDDKTPNLILIDAIQGRWEFPELKRQFLKHYERHQPDIVVVEKKAAGAPLIYELRSMGVPVSEYTPTRGTPTNPNTKIARVNSITDIFSSGFVWYPEGRRWAEEVIEQCAAFPAGEHDDYVDTVVMALLRYRQGGWVRTSLDYQEDEPPFRRRREYY